MVWESFGYQGTHLILNNVCEKRAVSQGDIQVGQLMKK